MYDDDNYCPLTFPRGRDQKCAVFGRVAANYYYYYYYALSTCTFDGVPARPRLFHSVYLLSRYNNCAYASSIRHSGSRIFQRLYYYYIRSIVTTREIISYRVVRVHLPHSTATTTPTTLLTRDLPNGFAGAKIHKTAPPSSI